LETDIEKTKRLQREEEQRIVKQRKLSNIHADSQVIFGSEKASSVKVEKKTDIRATDTEKEFEVKFKDLKLSRKARKRKARLKQVETYDEDSSPINITQIVVGFIGLAIVLMVGFVVFSQVNDVLNLDDGSNETTTVQPITTITEMFGFVSPIFYIIPIIFFAFIIIKVVLGGGGKSMNFMLMMVGGGLLFLAFKPLLNKATDSFSTMNATATGASSTTDTIISVFPLVFVGVIVVAALRMVNMLKSDYF